MKEYSVKFTFTYNKSIYKISRIQNVKLWSFSEARCIDLSIIPEIMREFSWQGLMAVDS